MAEPSSRYVDLTNAIAETAEPPASGQIFIRDARLPGFALRVTAGGVKSWVVEARVKGQRSTKRRTLGRYPQVKADRARTLALQELGRFAEGVDNLTVERKAKAKTVTLGAVFEDYMKWRDLKPGTVYLYRKTFEVAFSDWADNEITAITRTMVENRHAQISERAKAQANLAMRILRALLNFAIGKYEDAEGQPILQDNPVQRLSAVRAWNRVERRRNLIRPHQMPAWFEAVEALRENPSGKARTAADWLEFLILTGCRRTEGLRLTWEDVDLDARFFRLPDTKNHQVHELPLSDRLHELLLSRYPGPGATGPVFEGQPGLPLVEPRRWVKWVSDQSGVRFSPHDLRRTFATVAEGLDIPTYALKRLLNHISGTNDVTSGYLVIDVERLRAPMQRITDAILTAAGKRGTKADVIPIQSRLNNG